MVFSCSKCSNEYEFDLPRWRCDCGAYLKLEYDVTFTKADIVLNRYSMWRYEKAYPLSFNEISATFDEGLTPLVKIGYGGMNLQVKMDSMMPSASFKDRGMVMVVNYLKNRGVTHITEDSSGNAASSIAAYCGLADVSCTVYVPAGNSSGKILQTKAYGANVHPVSGSREDVAVAAQHHDESYAGHNWHPMFEVGCKSVAYEIWEQNDFAAPDVVLSPCGGGALILGLYKGFKELLKNKLIEKLPRVYGVQPENCNPIYRAFHGIEEEFIPKSTIAEGTSIANPIKLKEIVSAVKESQGQMVSVTDEETLAALPQVWHKGIYIEPTSATSFAAALKLKEIGEITADEKVIIVASGNGLKASDTIEGLLT